MVDLGLEDHVEFDDRFLAIDEIADLLAATDVFVTPYAGREQIASGALTFAIAAGCGVVSTPYWYAQDMLASGAGDARAVRRSGGARRRRLPTTSSEPERLAAARAEARRIGAAARLAVGRRGDRGRAARGRRARAAPPAGRSLGSTRSSSSLRTDHLLTLVDDVGIVQHANGVIPNRESGYCVDDVARLAVVALELARRGDEQVWTSIVYRSLAFLQDATDPQRRDAELHGLRPALARRAARRRPRRPLDLGARRDPLDRLGPRRRRPDAPTCSTTIVGTLGPDDVAAHRRLRRARPRAARPGPARSPRRRELLERLVDQLAEAYETHASDDWHWFEDALTYDNARLPHALIVGGVALGRDDLTETGLEALRWLGDESGLADGTLRLTGHRGRRRDEPAPGAGDEQPLDAVGLRRGRARRVRRHRRSRARRRARSGRSTGSSAATGSTGRSTTSRPAAAATGSARRRRTTTRAPSRRSPSTAQRCCSTRPDCPPSCATGPASLPRRERDASSSSATRPTRS